MNKVILFNPRATTHHPRIPNSVMAAASAIEGKYGYVIVDGNLEADPWKKIEAYLRTGEFGFFGSTVMPGPQLKQAIPFSKKIRKEFPEIHIVWGGYFPSNQHKPVLDSGYVDVVINGPGDKCFPLVLDALSSGKSLEGIHNIIYREEGKIMKARTDDLYDPDTIPSYNYDRLNTFYPLRRYLHPSFMGSQTIAYHSSFGCPFTCSFCGIVPIYNARWKGRSAELIVKDIRYIREHFGGDAIEFHDNNFFVSEKRTAAFSKLILPEQMGWWGEGRIDTIDKYKDETLELMRDAGCRMIFFGAETGNDEILKKMDKGGTQTGAQILRFASRMKKFGIVPEYSFVLGTPGETPAKVMQQIDADIAFIRQVKDVNPDTEIIIYLYSPVPTEGSELYQKVLDSGFRFPEKLEDWISPAWENFDLRKNPLTPWLNAGMVDKIKNFETVLNGYYPTVSDLKLSIPKRRILRKLSGLRYRSGTYHYPYEIKALQKLWKYRQPEIEGF